MFIRFGECQTWHLQEFFIVTGPLVFEPTQAPIYNDGKNALRWRTLMTSIIDQSFIQVSSLIPSVSLLPLLSLRFTGSSVPVKTNAEMLLERRLA